MRRASVLFALLALSACPEPVAGPSRPVPSLGCEDSAHSDICVPHFAEQCAPGSRPVLGSDTCAPVGVTDCKPGFEPDVSGWGCRPVLPANPCPKGTTGFLGNPVCVPVGQKCDDKLLLSTTHEDCVPLHADYGTCKGAQFELLGQETCGTLGDCAAAFPPADATLFVDPNAAEDATHFKTLGAAVAAAADGAVIALADGTYSQPVTIKKKVSVVGRCPAKAVLQGNGTAAGIILDGAQDVSLRGLAFRSWLIAVHAGNGARAALKDVLVEDAKDAGIYAESDAELTIDTAAIRRTVASDGRFAFGVFANSGAKVTLKNASLKNNGVGAIASKGAVLTAERVYVGGPPAQDPADGEVAGLYADAGGTLNVDFAMLEDLRNCGAFVSGTGAKARFHDVLVAGTEGRNGINGLGIQVDQGGALTLENSLVSHNALINLNVVLGSSAVVRDSVFSEGQPGANHELGAGISVNEGSTLDAENIAVLDNQDFGISVVKNSTARIGRAYVARTRQIPAGREFMGVGIAVIDSGHLVLERSTVGDNHQGGVLAGMHSTVAIADSVLRDHFASTRPTAPIPGGLLVDYGAAADVTRTAFLANEGSGMHVRADPVEGPGVVTVSDSVIADGAKKHGQGVLAFDGGRVTLKNTTVNRAEKVGLIAEDGSQLTLEDSVVRDTQLDQDGQFGRAVTVHTGTLTVLRSALVANRNIAIDVTDAKVEVRESLVAHTTPDATPLGTTAVETTRSELAIVDSAIVDTRDVGVHLAYGSRGTLERVLVDRTLGGAAGQLGLGLLADMSPMTVRDSVIARSTSAAILYAATNGAVFHSFVVANGVGVSLAMESYLSTAPALPDPLGEREVWIDDSNVFVNNATMADTGAFALPKLGAEVTRGAGSGLH